MKHRQSNTIFSQSTTLFFESNTLFSQSITLFSFNNRTVLRLDAPPSNSYKQQPTPIGYHHDPIHDVPY